MSLGHDILTSTPGLSEWSFVVLCLVSFLGSAVSAAFGLGGGALTIAALAATMPAIAIVPTHAIVQIGSNFFRAVMLWRHIVYTWMLPFVIGTVIGAAIGGQIVVALPRHILQAIIGMFVLYAVWGPSVKATRPSHATFGIVGGLASFATMFAGATGPLIAPFIKASAGERHNIVATHAAFMSWQHGVKIIMFGLLGFAFAPYVTILVAMVVAGIIGTWSGRFLLNWMPEKIFRWGFNIVLTAAALRLLYGAALEAMK